MKMNIDAIILSNSSDLTHYGLTCRTINSLKRSDSENEIEVCVVETQSAQEFSENNFLYNGCAVIHPHQQFGYNKFLNVGINQTNSEWILICNNDLAFTENWLTEAKRGIEKYPHIKSFSPRCPGWYLHEGLDGDIITGYTVSKIVCGWCILMHRSLISKYELFDEQFDFWYQDNDYAAILETNNEPHALLLKSEVYHVVSGSHDMLKERHSELTHLQQQKFVNKWGKHS